jgi:prolyl oligopeptidase
MRQIISIIICSFANPQMKSFPYKLLLEVLLLSAFPAGAQTDVLHLKGDVVDTFFSKAVADPYRWMENSGSDSVKQWLEAQKKMTNAEQKLMSSRFSNAVSSIEQRSTFRYQDAEKTGPYYFQMMRSANPYDPSPILYYRENPNDRFEEAFNPNKVSGHNSFTINQWELSDNGKYLAIALSAGGSDWLEIRVRDLDKNMDLKDRVNQVRFSSIVWWHDGFFYTRYPHSDQTAALGGHELYYHKLGKSQDDDELIMVMPSTTGNSPIEFQKTSNEKYLVVNKNQKIGKAWYQMVVLKDLSQGLEDEWKVLVQVPAKDKAFFEVVDYTDSGFIIHTNFKAPHGRVFIAKPDNANHFLEIVPESDKVLKAVTYVHHEIVTLYFTGGEYEVMMFSDEGKILNGIKFDPGIEVAGFKGSPNDSEAIFYMRTFYLPTMVDRYDFKTKKYEPVDKTHVAFDAGDFESEVVHYKSKDGTDVAMYLTYKKGLKRKGNNPVILYGYGGNGVPMTPFYRYSNIMFFENNGILAVPMIRGGGELGAEWHEGGKGQKKQNSFDDFVSAAQYLIDKGYTSKERLAIEGASNGGLLVGAVMTQHPELCKVVIATAGVYDMLRYPKFTGGKYWISEYGDPDKADDFVNLLSYSPLHNVKPGIAYPATLFITGRNDDRVVPLHTYKFLARLQECSSGNSPHILYFEENAGHYGATGYSDLNDQEAFILAFIFTEMNLPLKYF